ncbi:MAG: ATP-dependent Clp protease adaptor ClpS [Woeseiaceae bacterium]|nr:ATP-dependent Clp protease adaptor ClpS [Woeseiaceae bacterium]
MSDKRQSFWQRLFGRRQEPVQVANENAIDPVDESVPWEDAYEIVIFNDDVTPMEFVVELLEQHFLMSRQESVNLMLRVHTNGKEGVGRLAQQKADDICNEMLKTIRERQLPLKVEALKWTAARISKD